MEKWCGRIVLYQSNLKLWSIWGRTEKTQKWCNDCIGGGAGEGCSALVTTLQQLGATGGACQSFVAVTEGECRGQEGYRPIVSVCRRPTAVGRVQIHVSERCSRLCSYVIVISESLKKNNPLCSNWKLRYYSTTQLQEQSFKQWFFF